MQRRARSRKTTPSTPKFVIFYDSPNSIAYSSPIIPENRQEYFENSIRKYSSSTPSSYDTSYDRINNYVFKDY